MRAVKLAQALILASVAGCGSNGVSGPQDGNIDYRQEMRDFVSG